jgi:hypothetical protein
MDYSSHSESLQFETFPDRLHLRRTEASKEA